MHIEKKNQIHIQVFTELLQKCITIKIQVSTDDINPPWSESSDNAVSTEAVEALLGGHCVLQHVQADGTHEFTVQAARGHRYLQTIRNGLLKKHKFGLKIKL